MSDPRGYVTEQLSIIHGHPVSPTPAQVTRWWRAFTCADEAQAPRDRHGNACVDPVDDWSLHEDVAALAAADAPPRWPRGCRFAACLTHDVDRIVRLPWRERWRQLATLRGKEASLAQRLRWGAGSAVFALGALAGQSDIAPFDPWMAAEARYGFHSTFFVLPAAPRKPTTHDHYYRYGDAVRYRGERMAFRRAMQRALAEGWEIGLHGSYHSAYDTECFTADKAQLEDALAAPVHTTRQHYLRFHEEVTPAVQARAGMQADSTLGFNTTIGCRTGHAFPYFWPELDLLEAPLTIQDVGLLRARGRRVDLDEAIARARALIRRIADDGGVAVLSWHTHPESPGALPVYHALLATIAECQGWGCTLGELNRWWRARRDALVEQQRGISRRDMPALQGEKSGTDGVR